MWTAISDGTQDPAVTAAGSLRLDCCYSQGIGFQDDPSGSLLKLDDVMNFSLR